MTFNSLKHSVFNAISLLTFSSEDTSENEVNRIITGCLLFNLIGNLISADDSFDGRATSLANQYGENYKKIVENLKNQYVSYTMMVAEIKNNNIDSFLSMNQNQIQRIINLYENKTKVENFSVNMFSENMYKSQCKNFDDVSRLRNIHFKVMVPIVKYYIDNYNISTTSVVIESVNTIDDNIGKEIIFYIKGFSNSKVLFDAKNKAGISNYLYSAKIKNNKISLIIK